MRGWGSQLFLGPAAFALPKAGLGSDLRTPNDWPAQARFRAAASCESKQHLTAAAVRVLIAFSPEGADGEVRRDAADEIDREAGLGPVYPQPEF
jgi:hypothetical protein